MKLQLTLKNSLKIIGIFLLVSLVIFGIKGIDIYNKAFRPSVELQQEDMLFYVHSHDTYDDVMGRLDSLNIIRNYEDLLWVARKKNYEHMVKPGRYRIENNMNNNEVINMLRSGNQETVKVVISGKIRSVDQLAERVDQYLEAKEQEISNLLSDDEFVDSLGFNQYTILGMFIPNTYYFYWNTSAKEFIFRMKEEYDKYWNAERVSRAKKVDLAPSEVVTLASIVEEETIRQDEMDRIAGVYINRLNKGMKLRADPTIKFAHQNFGLRRIWNKHLTINSPYNTYKNYGLPPGPISVPSVSAIEAVLEYEQHEYLYFCAKDDFSGYHSFAKTHAQHIVNARKYRQALNNRSIYN